MNKKIQIKIVYNIEVVFLISTTETAYRNAGTIVNMGIFLKKIVIYILTNLD